MNLMKIVIQILIGLSLSTFTINATLADRLPSPMNETQYFSIDTLIDVNGSIEDDISIDWNIAKNNSVLETYLGKGEIISSARYTDTLLSNGGHTSENKNTVFDSSSRSSKSYTIDSEKVLTYNSNSGAHLLGDEYAVLDIDGNYSSLKSSEVQCVFADTSYSTNPAFSDYVKAHGRLLNINTARISTLSQLRNVGGSSSSTSGSSSIPAGINYQIAVSPDTSDGVLYAEGTVKTEFAGNIMEARDGVNKTVTKKNHLQLLQNGKFLQQQMNGGMKQK